MRVLVLSGPNLNLLGTREPEVYGTTTLSDLEAQITAWGAKLGIEASFLQSNSEGELVEAIQGAARLDGIVINPGALTHTSRSIGDAIRAVGVPAVEVHISNVRAREPWRSVSLVSEACSRTVFGRGFAGYRDALRHLANRAAWPVETIRYGPHRDNLADLALPEATPLGLVLLVHGGFWMEQWERDSMETLAVDLARRGLATLNLEYRRLGEGRAWPGSGHDVLSALRFASLHPGLADLACVVVGHSAGGLLGLWASGHHRDRRLRLMVGLGAVTDLAALAAAGAGGSSQARLLLDDGAPGQVGAIPGRTLMIHGSEDDTVPPLHSTRLQDEAVIEIVDGLGHFEVLDPLRAHWPLVVGAIERAMK
jgi:3-dehydroquinate dehydratase type II